MGFQTISPTSLNAEGFSLCRATICFLMILSEHPFVLFITRNQIESFHVRESYQPFSMDF